MKETEMFVMALFGFDRGHRAYLAMEGTGAKIYPSATVNFFGSIFMTFFYTTYRRRLCEILITRGVP